MSRLSREPWVALMLLWGVAISWPAATALGQYSGHNQLVLDFTQPEPVKTMAHWSHPDKFDLSRNGFGWDGDPSKEYDFWIETTQSFAVGWSFRTVDSVRIKAELEFVAGGGWLRRSSVVYARWSPDLKHWSTWQYLGGFDAQDKTASRLIWQDWLRIPLREQERYRRLLMDYSALEVPWGSDEEAAVLWILKQDPRFFDEHLPFIGYVQFLLEGLISGGERLHRLRFDLDFSASGLTAKPRDERAARDRDKIPWRFRFPTTAPAEATTSRQAQGK